MRQYKNLFCISYHYWKTKSREFNIGRLSHVWYGVVSSIVSLTAIPIIHKALHPCDIPDIPLPYLPFLLHLKILFIYMFIRRKNSHFMLSAIILTGKTIIPVHMNIKMKYESITNLLLICNFLCPCCAIPLLLYFLLFPSLTQVSWTQTSWNFHHNWCQLKSLEVHLFSGYTRAGSIYESLHKEYQHTLSFQIIIRNTFFITIMDFSTKCTINIY